MSLKRVLTVITTITDIDESGDDSLGLERAVEFIRLSQREVFSVYTDHPESLPKSSGIVLCSWPYKERMIPISVEWKIDPPYNNLDLESIDRNVRIRANAAAHIAGLPGPILPSAQPADNTPEPNASNTLQA